MPEQKKLLIAAPELRFRQQDCLDLPAILRAAREQGLDAALFASRDLEPALIDEGVRAFFSDEGDDGELAAHKGFRAAFGPAFSALGSLACWLSPPILTEVAKAFAVTCQEYFYRHVPVWLLRLADREHSALYRELLRACAEFGIQEGDIVFLPRITSRDFPALTAAMAVITRTMKAEVVPLFSMPGLGKPEECLAHRLAVYLLETLVLEGRCFPAAPDLETSRSYAQFLAAPMRVLPAVADTDGLADIPAFLRRSPMSRGQCVRFSRKPGPPHVLVAYPWGNLQGMRSGSSVRVNLMVKFLTANEIQASFLLPRQPLSDDYQYTQYEWPKTLPEIILPKLARFIEQICKSRDLTNLHLYNQSTYSRAFAFAFTQALLKTDTVLAEYPYYLRTMLPLTAAAGKNIRVTFHDDNSRQCRIQAVASYIRALDVRFAKRCASAFTVVRNEHEEYRKAGLENILVPTPAECMSGDDEGGMTGADCVDTSGHKRTLLFAGSPSVWNMRAKRTILHWAKRARKLGYDWHFYIVGPCGSPVESAANLTVTGLIPRVELLRMYRACALVLAPISYGAGCAVKVIEALGLGKPVLGTSVAFRGLTVTDGRECFIEDNLDNYIPRLQTLLKNPEQLAEVGKRAQAFAASYDYRVVFRPYLNFVRELCPRAD